MSVSDIAARCDVAPEAVRRWAAGKRRTALRPFPPAREVIGSNSGRKSMKIYAWAEVVSWVREVVGIDPDEGISYLDARQFAHLNAELADAHAITDRYGSGWRSMAATSRRLTTAVSDTGSVSAATVSSNTFSPISQLDGLLTDNDLPHTRRTACS